MKLRLDSSRKFAPVALVLGLLLTAGGPALADEAPYGGPAKAAQANRTIRVDMSDRMRFEPSHITVKAGEAIRFVVRNRGKSMHELVLGTDEELRAHAELMRRYPHMQHEEDNMVHVRPGRAGQFTWRFARPGEYRYACLVPGHFEAGMVGRVTVVP